MQAPFLTELWNNMPIKVLIVEDNANLRQALKTLLSLSADFICIGDYDRPDPSPNFIIVPDVILMDIDLPGENGIAYTRRIKAIYPEVNILMLTIVEREDKIMEAICAGASGYILKSAMPENILEHIRVLYKGGSPLTPSIARVIIANVLRASQTGKKENIGLTARETEILDALVKGLTYKKIAQRHFIAVDTVRSHIRGIYDKLNVHSRSEAIVKALNDKIV
jgi:DNA-binding NarL/FixJ family response regulator